MMIKNLDLVLRQNNLIADHYLNFSNTQIHYIFNSSPDNDDAMNEGGLCDATRFGERSLHETQADQMNLGTVTWPGVCVSVHIFPLSVNVTCRTTKGLRESLISYSN